MKRKISNKLFNELCNTIIEFDTATDNDTDPNWLSDGEWLDVFYALCCKICDEIREGKREE